jgi:hypothetical protein
MFLLRARVQELAQLPVGQMESEPPSPRIAAAAEWQLPAEWSLVNQSHGNRHLMLLDPVKHAEELAHLKSHWQATSGVGSILSVHRIQNPALHRRYEEAKQRLQQSGEQHETEVIAYHGTYANNPALIYDSPTGFAISKGHCAEGRGASCKRRHKASSGQSSQRRLSALFSPLASYLWTAIHAPYSSNGYQHTVCWQRIGGTEPFACCSADSCSSVFLGAGGQRASALRRLHL